MVGKPLRSSTATPMSDLPKGKRGWPKGKRRGPLDPVRKGKLRAGYIRSRHRAKLAQVAMARGHPVFGVGHQFSVQHSIIDTSPAAWRDAQYYVGDSEYVDDGLDECLLRALQKGLVYAHSVSCHHEPPFQDVTINVIAAAERQGMKFDRNGPNPRKHGLALPSKPYVIKRPITQRQLEIIGFLAAGLTNEQIAYKLGIRARTVKAHCDILRMKLGVVKRREIPFAYMTKTGKNPFTPISGISLPTEERVGTPLTTVVAEMFPDSREGKPLLQVVSELFDSLKGAS